MANRRPTNGKKAIQTIIIFIILVLPVSIDWLIDWSVTDHWLCVDLNLTIHDGDNRGDLLVELCIKQQ